MAYKHFTQWSLQYFFSKKGIEFHIIFINNKPRPYVGHTHVVGEERKAKRKNKSVTTRTLLWGGKGKPHATFFKSTFARLISFKIRQVGKIVNYLIN